MSTFLLYNRKSDSINYFDSPLLSGSVTFNYEVHRAKWLVVIKGIMGLPQNKKALFKILIFYNLMYLLFWQWKRKIYETHLLYAGNTLVHYTFVLPKCFRTPLMKNIDLEVGPCYTLPAYRGRGIAPYIASKIVKDHPASDIFFLVRSDNKQSTRLLEKHFVKPIGVCNRTKLFGIFPRFVIYHQNKMNNNSLVSIVIPCRNEEKFITQELGSIAVNDSPKDNLGFFLVDGEIHNGTQGDV